MSKSEGTTHHSFIQNVYSVPRYVPVAGGEGVRVNGIRQDP